MRFPIAKPMVARQKTAACRIRNSCRALAGPVMVLWLGAMLGACAMSMPIASLVTPTSHDDVTDRVEKPSLDRHLDAEDLRRAEAALATALDPRANGSLVAWENPQSGNKGSFTPRGSAYPEDAKICRNFAGEIAGGSDRKSLKGTACAEKGGEWKIAELDPSDRNRDRGQNGAGTD
jgi:surface antigen